MNRTFFRFAALAAALCVSAAQPLVTLDAPDTAAGYLARLLINEVPFPGEYQYVSEDDSRAGMLSILWVLHSRIHQIPAGYTQPEIAAIRSANVIDIITAGGEKGQVDGFYKDTNGTFRMAARVDERVTYLCMLANKGTKPGRFSRLLTYAQGLSRSYLSDGIKGADRYAGIKRIGPYRVTGHAYSWMTDKDCYHPGGNYVTIPDSFSGALGGNRFFTLKRKQP